MHSCKVCTLHAHTRMLHVDSHLNTFMSVTMRRDSLCHLRSAVEGHSDHPSAYVSRLFPNYPQSVFLTQRDSSVDWQFPVCRQ